MPTNVLVLSIIFAVAGLAYIALIHRLPYKGDFIIKAIPMICLANITIQYVPGTLGLLLFMGFLFSALGDISLCFKGDKFFLGGLSAFLVAHVLYVIAFAQNYAFSSADLPLIALWVVFAVGMLIYLSPKLGKLRIPVIVYVGVILTMVIFATLWQGHLPGVLLLGAVLFMLSDSMIAVDRFLKPIWWSRYFIMVTYYVGQFLIGWAFWELG